MKHNLHTILFKLIFIFYGTICFIPITAFPFNIGSVDTVLIPADDPRINYYGRFDFSTPSKPRFNWSGAVIEAAFPGPVIGMRMVHSNAYYDIEIDGKHDATISTGTNQVFLFRTDLSDQIHTVRIILRSEDHYNTATFLGLYIAKGKDLSDAPIKPERKIEFIGDSYTAGYGNEVPCVKDNLQKYTNANRAFAANITRAFHAQSIILAWSGKGMVRNYGENGKRSSSPFPAHYDQTLGEADKDIKWDFTKWIPQLVVICLGTNDYSTSPNPDDSMYIGDYHKFIARILGNYPEASILCVSTGSAAFERNVKRIVAEEAAQFNHPKVFFAPFPQGLSYSGCDGHPSVEDNKKIASALTDTIMKKMKWDTSSTVAVSQPINIPLHLPGMSFQRNTDNNTIFNNRFLSTTLRGECIFYNKTLVDNSFPMISDRHAPSIFISGNKTCGWKKMHTSFSHNNKTYILHP